MQQYNDEFLERWEHLINEVNKTEVPLECIKKIVVRLNGKKQKTINLGTLRKQGLDWEEIETLITRTLSSYGDTVADLEFVLDIVSVAEIIQPETDKLLSSLK
jgi:hypothetical protein